MTQAILRLPAVKLATGLSRSTLYLRIAHGVFTHPVSLGGRAVGWPAHASFPHTPFLQAVTDHFIRVTSQ